MISRRTFLKKTAGAGLMAGALVGSTTMAQGIRAPKALTVWGGWAGHEPEQFRDLMVPWMKSAGFDVTVSDTLDAYLDADLMASLDVIVQCWTMGQLSGDQGKALLDTVKGGVGFAGWHGGSGDSFREHTEYQFMVGGQWVAHPGGKIDYEVHIVDPEDEITRGMTDFHMPDTEQYYMHVDPNNKVLATTVFSDEHAPWIGGTVVPVVWKKMYGKGRVFYSSLGHSAVDYKVPQAFEIAQRGIIWASKSKTEGPEAWVQPAYPKS
jgi:type 1 glutamine amidotransferase